MEKKRQQIIEKALEFISEIGWTVQNIEFLHELTKYLGNLFQVDYVLIARYSENKPDFAETVSIYNKTAFLPNMVYELLHTPCENVIGKKLCCYKSDIQILFPKDELLVQMNVDSYIGIPLWSSDKNPIGLIVIMDNEPLSDIKTIEIVFKIVAIRAAHELEKMLLQNKLKISYAEISEKNKQLENFNTKLEQEIKKRTKELTESEEKFKAIYEKVSGFVIHNR